MYKKALALEPLWEANIRILGLEQVTLIMCSFLAAATVLNYSFHSLSKFYLKLINPYSCFSCLCFANG